jgi:hypothetical protein
MVIATNAHAQAATKTIDFSICGGSDCHNNASQHNFTQPGKITLPTGLPAAVQIKSFSYSCAAFCSHEVLWPVISLGNAADGAHFTLNAHHAGSVTDSSRARTNVLTLKVWIHY